jgi:hypothetical protein
VEEYHDRGIPVCFVKLREHNQLLFWRSGLMELIGVYRMFSKTIDALSYLEGVRKDYSSYQIRVDDETDPKRY